MLKRECIIHPSIFWLVSPIGSWKESWMKRNQHTHTNAHTHMHACIIFMLGPSWPRPWAWAAVALQLPNQNKQTPSILSLLWSDGPEAWILNHSKKSLVWQPLVCCRLSGDPCHYRDNTQQLTFFSPTWLPTLSACHHYRKEGGKIADGQFNGRLPEASLDRTSDTRCLPQGEEDKSFFCLVTHHSALYIFY